MKKIFLAKRRLLKWLIGTLSFSSALFVFQACYGVPQNYTPAFMIEGHVKSSKTSLPVAGIKVSIEKDSLATLTDSQGRFEFFPSVDDSLLILKFEDTDSTLNGRFATKDTTIRAYGQKATVEISLEEI